MDRTEIPPKILIPRGRGAAAEAQRDADVLRFVGRFRFVSDALLAKRFGVSRQQMNLRLRRLTAAGLLQRTDSRTQPRLTMLTRKGARAVDLPIRRAPRTDAQREHELSLVWLVIDLERAGGVRVLTERECRTLEAAGAGQYSVAILQPDHPQERRWPDLVLEGDRRRSAIELELSAKGTTRLQAIVDAYAAALAYDEVVFLAVDAAIARRLAGAVRGAELPLLAATYRGRTTRLRVELCPGRDVQHQRAIKGADEELRLTPADAVKSPAGGAARIAGPRGISRPEQSSG